MTILITFVNEVLYDLKIFQEDTLNIIGSKFCIFVAVIIECVETQHFYEKHIINISGINLHFELN